ncbi:hypothetical protein B0H19DRAFT_1140734 [Mycena capillaripes]|nr:hypothetical protein B0H19DRAFT_1140734 [Mycena capillaripes]
MPYLFAAEHVGYRDEPGQPWEGTRGDWSDLEPELSRSLLPFPVSPLDYKHEGATDEATEAAPRRHRADSDSPPPLSEGYIPFLGVTQALQETQFLVNGSVYQLMSRFWVRPRDQRQPADPAVHATPFFVHKQWDNTSNVPVPPWASDASQIGETGWTVKTLQQAVRCVLHYARKRENALIAPDLRTWAQTMTPNSSGDSKHGWALSTPPRTSQRVAASTRNHVERFHWEAIY